MRRLPHLLLALGLTAAACGASGIEGSAFEPTTTTSATTTTVAATTTAPETTTTTTVAETTTSTTISTTSSAAFPAAGCPPVDRPMMGAATNFGELAAWDAATGEEVWSMFLAARFALETQIEEEALVVLFFDGRVLAMDAVTCTGRWQADMERLGQGLDVVGDVVYATDRVFVHAYSLVTGSVIWEASLGEARKNLDEEPLVVADDIVIVADARRGKGLLHGYDAATGERLYEVGLPRRPTDIRAPAVDDGLVFVVIQGDLLSAHDIETGRQEWSANLGFSNGSAPVTSGGQVFVAGRGGNVAAFDTAAGEVVWSVDLEEEVATVPPGPDPESPIVTARPGVAHDEVHVLAASGALHHLSAQDGSTVFVGKHPATTLSETHRGRVLEHAEEGTVTGIDLEEQELWVIAAGGNGVDRFTSVTAEGPLVISHTWTSTLEDG